MRSRCQDTQEGQGGFPCAVPGDPQLHILLGAVLGTEGASAALRRGAEDWAGAVRLLASLLGKQGAGVGEGSEGAKTAFTKIEVTAAAQPLCCSSLALFVAVCPAGG